MKKYISLDVLVAEVEKRRDKNTRNKLNLAAAFEDNYLLSFIDTLTVLTLDDIKEMENQAFLHGIDVERNKNIFKDNKEIKI